MTIARRLVCLLILAAAPAMAQGPLQPAWLPPDTLFYLHWKGAAQLDAARGTNSLARLWNDPEFAPVRRAAAESLHQDLPSSNPAQSLTPEEREQAVSLLESPVLLGFSGRWPIPASAQPSREESGSRLTTSGGKHQRPAAFFLILDATGKEALARRLMDRMANSSGDKPVVTSYAFGASTVEKVASAAKTYYRGWVGRYFLRADRQDLLEDLVTRFSSPDQPKDSLRQTADFQTAAKQIAADGVLEFFARFPDLSMAALPANKGLDLATLLRALRLDQLKAFCGSVSLAGETTRLHVTMQGNTSPGGIFDFIPEGKSSFATLALAPPGTVYYNATQLNLTALYRTVRNAIAASLQPEQRGGIDLMESSVATRIGMSIPDAIALFRGEAAAIIPSASDISSSSSLFAATIQNPAGVLRLLGAILSERIANEEREGDTTYLALSLHSSAGAASRPQRHFYYLAVTPQMLIAAPRKRMLRDAVARLGPRPGAAPATLESDAGFRRARARYPDTLTGLGYFPFGQEVWEKSVEAIRETQKRSSPSAPLTERETALLKFLSGPVVSRYVHALSSGSWKDREGVYFDVVLE